MFFINADLIKHICKIDINLYKCAAENIITDEVILTKKQAKHIKDENNRDVLDKYIEDFPDILNNPDYLLKDKKENTVKVIKTLLDKNNETVHIVLRLAVVGDNPNYKNSIITAWELSDKSLRKILRNKPILYSSKELNTTTV